MRLVELRIERFRGIRALHWNLSTRLTCLVGPGDSSKTTILDAVGLLGSTRAGGFSDKDFYGARIDDGPIVIEGIFADLPAPVLTDQRFGLDLIGVDNNGQSHDEPGDHQPAVRVRLDVDESLEPVWRVLSARNPDGRVLSARDRATLAISRLGDDPERQFSLGRGSALSRTLGSNDEVAAALADSYRRASIAASATDLSALDPAIELASLTAVQMGAGALTDDLSFAVEISPTSAGGLTLHSGDVPVRAVGLGTRRLVALGIELGGAAASGVVCIDELEHGLEPHRVRHLVRTIRTLATPVDDGLPASHVLFTSHSSVVLGELGADGVCVVHRRDGVVDVQDVPNELTALVRATPEALLARRVIVGEGKTEVGFIRAFDRYWAPAHNGQSLAQRGVAVVEGGGSDAAARALQLAELGYDVLLLADSDVELKPTGAELRTAGVEVVLWPGASCTETRVLADLSWNGVVRAFDFVVADARREPSSVIDAVLGGPEGATALARAGLVRRDCGDDLDSLLASGMREEEVRAAFANAAARKEWFKRIDRGEALGDIVTSDQKAMTQATGSAMSRVEAFSHA